MSLRQVKTYKSNPEFIQKSVNLKWKIPLMTNLVELEKNKTLFNKTEYLSLYQQYKEQEIYDSATWEERKILAPLLDYYFDNNNTLVLIFPRFEPLVEEDGEFRFSEEEIISILQEKLCKKGLSDEEVGQFIQQVINFCEDFDINEDDCLLNLNNIGWSNTFGPRIIDWGLTNSICKEYYNG